MKRIFTITLISLFISAPGATAADCTVKACIDVYTQDGHIVIEGRKGSGPKSTKAAVPRPKATKKAVAPKPKSTIAAKPVVRKSRMKAAPRKVTQATSLEDKLIESIPTAGISYQPSFSPLVQTPVYFWSDIPTLSLIHI